MIHIQSLLGQQSFIKCKEIRPQFSIRSFHFDGGGVNHPSHSEPKMFSMRSFHWAEVLHENFSGMEGAVGGGGVNHPTWYRISGSSGCVVPGRLTKESAYKVLGMRKADAIPS